MTAVARRCEPVLVVVAPPRTRRAVKEVTWPQIAARAPIMAATMANYLDQLAVSSRPATVVTVDLALRLFAGRVTTAAPSCRSVASIGRVHIEDFKTWQAARPGRGGKLQSTTTIRHRLSFLRTFFERLIEWDDDDAPVRVPIFSSDFPALDEPLPKFLDDPTAARFMAALAIDPDPRRRLMVELLARTGMRAGELAGLRDDAMVRIGDTSWLRIPVGKLHNDRYVPLLPLLVGLIDDHRAARGPSRSGYLVERNDGNPYERRTIHRYVAAVAKRAGVGHVHPHQLRHTLATQAINRGMSLEAIAALLGHRSMDMTLVYARISDRTVADEYFKVTEAVEANYRRGDPLPADVTGKNMTKLAADHRRHLGNGHCTRPAALDCTFESMCERCGFFETGPQFVTILRRQRDHAAARAQDERIELLDGLIAGVAEVS
jgi:integrase